MIESDFLTCARTIGLDRRIAELIADCDRALAALPDQGAERWRARIADQRRRLADLDLTTLVAITTALAEETPSLAPLVARAMSGLVRRHPALAPFQARLRQAARAKATAA